MQFLRDVRFGPLEDMLTSPRHVRFTPNNGRWAAHLSPHPRGKLQCEDEGRALVRALGKCADRGVATGHNDLIP